MPVGAMPIATMPIAPMIPSTGLLGYNGYNNGYSGYNSGGFLSGIMNSGIGSGLLSHHLPGLSGLPVTPVTPITTPAITPTSYMTPFSGITGSNHHHSNGLFHS
jgi:hypothetical protein